MRRVTAVVLPFALLALASCTLGKVSQDATVTVRGTVEDIDGRPLAGAKVVLVKEADFGEVVLGATLFTGTLGTVCLVDRPPAICNKAHTVTTGADGTYGFELEGRDTQGSAGNAATLYLSAGPPGGGGGASVSARFQVQKAEMAVPPLRIWAPQPQVTVGRVARAEWAPLDGSRSERFVFSDGPDGEITWIADGRSPLSIDGRILEDSTGTAAAEATTTEEADGTTYRITHRSAQVPFTSGAGPAPSRGATCTPSPCPVTDGRLTSPSPPPPPTMEVMVDLGVNRNPTLIVVRGCPVSCNVETSLNRVDWTIVGTGDRPYFSVTPVAGRPVHFVRVTSTSDLSQLAEISVWD